MINYQDEILIVNVVAFSGAVHENGADAAALFVEEHVHKLDGVTDEARLWELYGQISDLSGESLMEAQPAAPKAVPDRTADGCVCSVRYQRI